MSDNRFLPAHEIRGAFSNAMSKMYRDEVPLYGDLLDIVNDVNAKVLAEDAELAEALDHSGEIDRLGQERHGAIRVGTAEELAMLRRVLAVMGLFPVDYYDLTIAGVPVHSTAFRPTDAESLAKNPFRIFTSLLRLELIENQDLRAEAERLLAARKIFSDEAIQLVEQFERDGGLDEPSSSRFVAAVLETFRWHDETLVDAETYAGLLHVHRLVADVVSFKGPHINHLTPRTLDIDAAQTEMEARGMGAKAVIEGPPRRRVPILLRQTSFKALEEEIRFKDADNQQSGTHTARFGEIEQRGVALTRKGRELYDRLLVEARGEEGSQSTDYQERLAAAFQQFPDDLDSLRRQGLAYFSYHYRGDGAATAAATFDLDALIAEGVVEAIPLTYEDFLPVSAAGIFQSNLGGGEQRSYSAAAARAGFEKAMGCAVTDAFALYDAQESNSIAAVEAQFQAMNRKQQIG